MRSIVLRGVVLVATFFAFASMNLAQADAEGANLIASAPTVAYGMQETGNTGNGLKASDVEFQSFWKLRVKAGDTLTIDWEAPKGTHIEVFAPGTNDFNLTNASPVHKGGVGPTGRNQLKFVASRSGLMPLAFETDIEFVGPYAFTARVRHWRPHTG